MILLLVALREINKPAGKQEVLSFIEGNNWIDIRMEDKRPYPGSRTDEARWRTLVAWARENCAEHGWIAAPTPRLLARHERRIKLSRAR